MIGHFRTRYGLTGDRVSEDELRLARKYVTDKFSTPEWTARVP